MSLLNEEVKGQLKEVFGGMKNEVTIALFLGETGCDSCKDTKDYMEDVESLTEKINLEIYDIEKDSEKAKELNVENIPAIVLLDANKKDNGVKYYGIPAGHEINSFVTGVLEVSGAGEKLSDSLESQIKAIDKKVDIKVFITLSCPHCPGAVSKAHKLALMNENISGVMIEAQTFNELSNKFNVSGVPKIIINDKYELVGNQPIEKFLEEINKIG
jgi:glutaredoxin-like protein